MAVKNRNLFISFDHVSLRIDNQIAFPESSWEFFDDEHWAIVGDNGSGKSILARAFSGQVPAVKGKIVYHFLKTPSKSGFSNSTIPLKHAISYVSFDKQKQARARADQIYQARWHSSENIDAMTVSEYLSEERVYHINPYQVDAWHPDSHIFKADRKNIISTLAIQGLIKKKIIQLSNGEMRKVMLARALLTRPRLLILDSPLAGLDQDYRVRLKATLENLMKDRLRIIIVTSREDEILPDITHVMVIENLKITAAGPKQKVIGTFSKMREGFSPMEYNLSAHQKSESRPKYKDGDVLVDMKNINVSYDGMSVLCNINWTIKKGDQWALVGPNGSGKTTLLSLILGDNPQAYANDLRLFGKRKGSGESIWEIKHNIGFVSPELHLYFPRRISGLDAVCTGFFDSLGLYARCSMEQRRMAKFWMENLGLFNYAETMFDTLSDGIQRMILIARALVKQPLLLFMDEPCQGLDIKNRHRVLNLVDAIGDQLEVTVIFVTHDMDELPSIITQTLKLGLNNAI
ncbi:MAG: ATP-binding cassette domain-containing protein [Deltaproteobacteria bacterium]|nr:ATP-binding cassette domain-containing protein [Deltaproteobacteria bacterium]